MAKKMLLSTFICFLITVNIFIWYFISGFYKEKETLNGNVKAENEEIVNKENNNSLETNSTQESAKIEKENRDNVSEKNPDYLYAITDLDIDKAIKEGVKSKDYIKDYDLYKQYEKEEWELSFIASIDTPYHKVASYASTTYFKEDLLNLKNTNKEPPNRYLF